MNIKAIYELKISRDIKYVIFETRNATFSQLYIPERLNLLQAELTFHAAY
jgi:hypothetical protein